MPGPGWIAFDPTNGTMGGDDLIRVAVARDIHQIVPISGSFHGTGGDYLGMEVAVTVQSVASPSLDESASRRPIPLDRGREVLRVDQELLDGAGAPASGCG